MLKIQFHDVAAFFNEIEEDRELIDRLILRLIFRRVFHDPFVVCSVVAAVRIGDTIVRMDHRLGQCFKSDEKMLSDIAVQREKIMHSIIQQAENLGLEIRAGSWEDS